MFDLILAGVLAAAPTPYERYMADQLLAEPVGLPAEENRSPRFHVALLLSMRRDGAVDPGCEGSWFGPSRPFASELDLARGLTLKVRGLPPADWAVHFPPADYCRRVAEFNRAVSVNLRERAVWEADRAEVLTAAADECDGLAGRWDALAAVHSPATWPYPLRARLWDAVQVLGEDGVVPVCVPRCFTERR